eukprot:gnl/Trimastix_PCT/857.p1 GENE.gnl/Trimastix_PCT/857~~gnl/Trimastix_PCT/857.p1  ORF type:complete len:554 (-),score=160.26 gnl/Trimastix_PCT/857:942-2603(-)
MIFHHTPLLGITLATFKPVDAPLGETFCLEKCMSQSAEAPSSPAPPPPPPCPPPESAQNKVEIPYSDVDSFYGSLDSEGQFQKGSITWHLSDGTVVQYSGNWKDNQPHQWGTLVRYDPNRMNTILSKYEGGWKDGARSGFGVQTYPSIPPNRALRIQGEWSVFQNPAIMAMHRKRNAEKKNEFLVRQAIVDDPCGNRYEEGSWLVSPGSVSLYLPESDHLRVFLPQEEDGPPPPDEHDILECNLSDSMRMTATYSFKDRGELFQISGNLKFLPSGTFEVKGVTRPIPTRHAADKTIEVISREFMSRRLNREKREIQIIPPDEVTEMTPLGRGGAATVFRGVWQNEVVAVKKGELFDLLEEALLLGPLSHCNVIRCRGFIPEDDFLVMEYAANGSLQNVIDTAAANRTPIPQDKFFRYVIEIAQGMQYLQSRRVIHRDLKPANLLLDKNDTVKIADVGIGKKTTHDATVFTIHAYSPGFNPPEHRPGALVTPKIDNWAYGENLRQLFQCSDIKATRMRGDLRELVAQCKADNPEERPSFGQIIEELSRIRDLQC